MVTKTYFAHIGTAVCQITAEELQLIADELDVNAWVRISLNDFKPK